MRIEILTLIKLFLLCLVDVKLRGKDKIVVVVTHAVANDVSQDALEQFRRQHTLHAFEEEHCERIRDLRTQTAIQSFAVGKKHFCGLVLETYNLFYLYLVLLILIRMIQGVGKQLDLVEQHSDSGIDMHNHQGLF